MSGELIGTVLTGVGLLVAFWRMVNAAEARIGGEIRDVRRELSELRRELTGQIGEVEARLRGEIAAVNTRIDAVLLADRDRQRAAS